MGASAIPLLRYSGNIFARRKIGCGAAREYRFFFHVETVHSGPGPPHYRGFTITFINDTPHSVGPLWTSDQPDAEIST